MVWTKQDSAVAAKQRCSTLAETWKHFRVIKLRAYPNATCDAGSKSVLSLVLCKYHPNSAVSQSLLPTLPRWAATRDVIAILQENRYIIRSELKPLSNEYVTLFLQHGARIRYFEFYLKWTPVRASKLQQHSEEFIELLRAAETDFSGVRQRIAGVEKDEWTPLNLTVLDQKLSQPLTLEAWCVISVRRHLLSVCGRRIWARIEELRLPQVISDRLKLKTV